LYTVFLPAPELSTVHLMAMEQEKCRNYMKGLGEREENVGVAKWWWW
jgi:hypothetical protein